MHRRRLLHVDTAVDVLDRIGADLADCGFEVESITEPAHCILRMEEGDHRVLLLGDLRCADDVFSLLREVHQRDASVEIALLTNPQPTTAVLKSIRLGADYCIFKPLYDIAPLVDVLEAVYLKLERQWTAVLRSSTSTTGTAEDFGRLDRLAREEVLWLAADALPETNGPRIGEDRRRAPRVEMQATAVAVPVRNCKYCVDAAFPVITRDISLRGLGLIAPTPVQDDELLVCAEKLDPNTVFRVVVRSNLSADDGSHRLGVEIREVLERSELEGFDASLSCSTSSPWIER
ncbi:MAG: PilZ domain-containing protein [Pirellulaceae bacterium]